MKYCFNFFNRLKKLNNIFKMDWQSTYNRKRRASRDYDVESKYPRLIQEPIITTSEQKKQELIYSIIHSNATINTKLTALIINNEFDFFKKFLFQLHDRMGVHLLTELSSGDVYRAVLDMDNKAFYDLVIFLLQLKFTDFLDATLFPPDLKRFKRLESYGGLLPLDVLLPIIAGICDASEILEYVMKKYNIDFDRNRDIYWTAIKKAVRENCIDNFRIMIYKIYSDGHYTIEVAFVIKHLASAYNRKEILKIIERYKEFLIS